MNFSEMIGGKTDRKPKLVSTPEWPDVDGKLFVRRLTMLERVEFYSAANKQQATAGAAFQSFVVAYCACDEAGTRGFTDDEWKTLQNEPGSVVERISDAADEWNLLSFSARETVKKNLETPLDSGSIPGSLEKPA